MIIMIPFKGEHLRKLSVQPSQKDILAMVTDEALLEIEKQSDAYTFMDGDEVVAICGTAPYGDGRALAWSFLSSNIKHRMVSVTRYVKDYLKKSTYRRIEMSVDCDHPEAHRWARMLGFECEAERMKKYSADGRDCALYALVGG